MKELFPPDTVFTVSQITDLIKATIENCFPAVSIEAEISNFRPSSTGHWYFTLKDETAAISAVMFKGKAHALTFMPQDGMRVRVKGALSVYAQRGTYQIIVDKMEQAGTGDILQLLEARKRALASEGLFDSERKKSLPRYPLTVGVVTSPTGAALRDILNITRRRNDAVSVVVLPCAVQGEEAAKGIIAQIKAANEFKLADVLIIGRGGGSLEDLLPFSDEGVVRAVAASQIPTVSAVGHEVDVALSDFAADVRAPTPSAAAELVTPLKSDILYAVQSAKENMIESINAKTEKLKLMVKSFSRETMELQFRSIELPLLQRFDVAKETLIEQIRARLNDNRNRIALLLETLQSANPDSIRARGYSVVYDAKTNTVVRNADECEKGAVLVIKPSRGTVTATVTETGA